MLFDSKFYAFNNEENEIWFKRKSAAFFLFKQDNTFIIVTTKNKPLGKIANILFYKIDTYWGKIFSFRPQGKIQGSQKLHF